MKKDPNSGETAPNHSLPRSNILRGRRNFERLFEKSTVYNSDSLQLRFRYYADPAEGCFVGFIAPKKRIRKAVKRNKIKRLMREVYRTNQHFFGNFFSEKNFGMHAVFIANKDSLTYWDIYRDMIALLEHARDKLIILSNKTPKKAPDQKIVKPN
jgi:ribonuclease P protein component